MKRLSIIVLSILFSWMLHGQTQPRQTYKLLWKISGNGLSAPSYVFGTAHLKDRRVFNFSDEVMASFESATAFVTEIHPDSIVKFSLSALNNLAETKLPKLSNQQANQVMQEFERKNGFKPDSSILKNPLLINSLIGSNYERADDMPYVMDILLYGLARTKHKAIHGLERMEDQADKLLDGSEEGMAKLFQGDSYEDVANREMMIDIYARGDLDALGDLLATADHEWASLVSRNRKMTRGILDLLQRERLFVAVGAAHLPGNQGVIALLEKEGYEVTLMPATFTELASNYRIDQREFTWHRHIDEINNFTIEFPSVPVARVGKGNMDLLEYADLIDGRHYQVYARFVGPLMNNGTPEKYLAERLSSYIASTKGVLISEQSVDRNGATGIAARINVGNLFVSAHFIWAYGTYYLVQVEGSEDVLATFGTDRFLNSMTITKPRPTAIDAWRSYSNGPGAFEINLPEMPQEMTNEVADPSGESTGPYMLKLFHAVDKERMINYLIRYNDFPKGMYLIDKAATFAEMVQQYMKLGVVLTAEPQVIYKQGIEGRRFELTALDNVLEVEVYLRGNRFYLLQRQNMTSSATAMDDPFFDSFTFKDYEPYLTYPYTLANMTVQMPGEAMVLPDEGIQEAALQASKTYFSINEKSGALYGFEYGVFDKYVYIKHPDSLFQSYVTNYRSERDSLIYGRIVDVGGRYGKEFYIVDSISGNDRRVRIWIDGGTFFMQSAFAHTEELQSAYGDVFFDSVTVETNAPVFDLGVPKAAKLMEDLKSPDSTVYRGALKAMTSYYSFETADLSLLYDGLTYTYAEDSIGNEIKTSIVNELQTINDDGTAAVLQATFADETSNDAVKAAILGAITNIDPSTFDWYFNTLVKATPFQVDNTWRLFSPLYDSIGFVADRFVDLMPLLAHQPYRPQLLSVISEMVSDTVGIVSVSPYGETLSSFAMEDLQQLENQPVPDDYIGGWPLISYLNILSKVAPIGVVDVFSNRLTGLDAFPFLVTTAVVSRIKAGLTVDQALLSQQLDSLLSRHQLMLAFDEVGKLDEVPARYREQVEVAQMLFHSYLNDYYDYNDSISVLGSMDEEDGRYYVFEFSYEYDDDKSKYLGICGPFLAGTAEWTFDGHACYTDLAEMEEDWRGQASAMVKALVEAN